MQVLVPGETFQRSLIIASKAVAYLSGAPLCIDFWQFQQVYTIHRLGTRLDFGTGQIAIFIGELYFMQPFTLQVKHLIPFPRMGIHQNILNKMN
jgi:hypothetical protein